MSGTRIEGGVEWFPIDRGDGHPDEDCQCARCGSSVTFIECQQCDDGYIEREQDWQDYDVPRQEPCDWCAGNGGWWYCLSTYEHCKANPIPGREYITPQPFRAEAP